MQSDCNQQNQIGLRQDCQVIEGLHQNPGISTNCNQPSPIAPRIGLPRKSVGDPPEVPQCLHNLLQFRAIQRIGTELQIQCNPASILCRPARQDSGLRQNALGQARAGPLLQSIPSNPIPAEIDTTELDCKTTKDCNVIGRIALKLHGLQVNRSNCTSHMVIGTSNPPNLLQSGLHAPVQMQDKV